MVKFLILLTFASTFVSTMAKRAVDRAFETRAYTFVIPTIDTYKNRKHQVSNLVNDFSDVESLDFTPYYNDSTYKVASRDTLKPSRVIKDKLIVTDIDVVSVKNEKIDISNKEIVIDENVVTLNRKNPINLQTIHTVKKITPSINNELLLASVDLALEVKSINRVASKNKINTQRTSADLMMQEESKVLTVNSLKKLPTFNKVEMPIQKQVSFTTPMDELISLNKDVSGKQNSEVKQQTVNLKQASIQKDSSEPQFWDLLDVKKDLKKTAAVVEPSKRDKRNDSFVDDKDAKVAEFKKSSDLCEVNSQKSNRYDYSVSITTYNNGKSEKLHDYEFRFQDDVDFIKQADKDGEISLKGNMLGTFAARSAKIYSRNTYPQIYDLRIFSGSNFVNIPTLSKDFLNGLLAKYDITDGFGSLLVELNRTTEDVELDVSTQYGKKLYLNSNLFPVSPEDNDYNFVLFVGIDPGNTILSYRNNDSKVHSKIIHIQSDYLIYEYDKAISDKKFDLCMYEENLLSKDLLPLDVSYEDVNSLNSKTKTKKILSNQYQFKKLQTAEGSRKYFYANHLEEPIYFGTWGQSSIVLPSEEYMRFVMRQFPISTNSCLIQINLSKEVKEFIVNGNNNGSYIGMNFKMLDSDGLFYDDISSSTKRIFIQGETQGQIDLLIRYVDNSETYLKSVCSSERYIVEQI